MEKFKVVISITTSMKLCTSQMAVILLLILVVITMVGIFFQQIVLVITSVFGILGDFVVLISQWYKKKQEDKRRQDRLILDELKNWMNRTTFSNIKYNWVKAEPTSHKDPNDLAYFNQDVKVLKAYGAITEWEKGKTISDILKTDGVESLQKFHRIVNKKLEKLPLKKSLEIGTLSEPYYSVPRIHEAIFEEISGNKSGFVVRPLSRMIPPPDLYSLDWGATTLAWGNKKTMNLLKKIIKELIEDEGVRREIESFNDVKKKLDSREPFMEFEKKLKKAITDFRWNQEFNP